ncbi:MAG: biopolymer transporter ExbD [Planctomycetota bacterium]
MKFGKKQQSTGSELDMTSMIDVVFLLLIFFVLTFKVVELEGDFSVKMPAQGQGSVSDNFDEPYKLRLECDDQGNLTQMTFAGSNLGTDFNGLRQEVINRLPANYVPDASDEGPEVEIDADFNLRYRYVIDAISHVSGRKSGSEIMPLIQRIKFAKQRK